jgi:hypothetical protein
MLAAVFVPAGVGVWHAGGIADRILVETDRVHALRQETTAVRIDKPEHSVALIDAKKAAPVKAVIGDSTPFGSLQTDAPPAK